MDGVGKVQTHGQISHEKLIRQGLQHRSEELRCPSPMWAGCGVLPDSAGVVIRAFPVGYGQELLPSGDARKMTRQDGRKVEGPGLQPTESYLVVLAGEHQSDLPTDVGVHRASDQFHRSSRQILLYGVAAGLVLRGRFGVHGSIMPAMSCG